MLLKEALYKIQLPPATLPAAPAATPPALAAPAATAEPPPESIYQDVQDIPDEIDPPAEPALSFWDRPVPYIDGVIDWGQLEDDLPIPESEEEFECQVQELDFSQQQPSNLHSYFHASSNMDCRIMDCRIIGHRCNCENCREIVQLASPLRKRPRQAADTTIL